MKTIRSLLAASLGLSSLALQAGSMGPAQAPTTIYPFAENWSVTGSVGYGNYNDVYSNDGAVTLGRLAIGKDVLLMKRLTLGLEVGVQNGNRMRLDRPQSALDVFNELPIDSTLKPMWDLLVTAKTPSFGTTPLFAQLKGGLVYRQWQFDGVIIQNKSKVDGEFQAGLGYRLSDSASLTLSYQGIFGGNPGLSANPTSDTGTVTNIPVLNAGLFGFTWTI